MFIMKTITAISPSRFAALALTLLFALGVWADDDIQLTKTEQGSWTMQMPDYHVKLEIVYYTDQELADFATFQSYQEAQLQVVDAMYVIGDSQTSIALWKKAKADISAVTYDEEKTLSENKDVLDTIVRQLASDLAAQRAAESLAADKVAFDNYKAERVDAVGQLTMERDSQTSLQLIANAQAEISALTYDEGRNLDANKATVDAIISRLRTALEKQRGIDDLAAYKQAFAEYKVAGQQLCDQMAKTGDSPRCLLLIADAKGNIEKLTYNEQLEFFDNMAAVDAIVYGLKAELEKQRELEDEDPQTTADKLAFANYKSAQLAACDAMAQDNDSETCRQYIANAKSTIANMVYNTRQSLDENKALVDGVVAQLSTNLEAQRAAENEKTYLAEFEAFKERQITLCNNMRETDDDEECQALIADAIGALEALTFDKSRSLTANKADAEFIVSLLMADLYVKRAAKREAAEQAARLAAFADYKTAQVLAADALALEDDSEASQALIADAKALLSAAEYDTSKSLDANMADLDALIQQLTADLDRQRTTEREQREAAEREAAEQAARLAAFEEYKTNQTQAADALALEEDSPKCLQLIADAKLVIDALQYDSEKTLDENCAALAAIVEQLSTDLDDQRTAERQAKEEAEYEANLAAFNSYKTIKTLTISWMEKSGDSEACRQLIADAKTAVEILAYDREKTLDENRNAIDAIATQLEAALETQRLTDGIDRPGNPRNDRDVWYDLQGHRLDAKPARPGLYIRNGKKVMVK